MKRRFEWDAAKAISNYQKHGVTFEDAALVFKDPFAIIEQDRIENGEERWRTVGMSGGVLLLLVAHTLWFEDDDTEVIRIISARPLDRKERRDYEYGQLYGR